MQNDKHRLLLGQFSDPAVSGAVDVHIYYDFTGGDFYEKSDNCRTDQKISFEEADS